MIYQGSLKPEYPSTCVLLSSSKSFDSIDPALLSLSEELLSQFCAQLQSMLKTTKVKSPNGEEVYLYLRNWDGRIYVSPTFTPPMYCESGQTVILSFSFSLNLEKNMISGETPEFTNPWKKES
jgi:hypothetical protein